MKAFNWKLVGILTALCIGLFYLCGADFLTALQSPIDFNEVAAEEIKPGVRAEGEVYAILDQFAEEESWTERSDGSRSAKKTCKKYYIIPIGEQEYIGYAASSPNFSQCNKIVDATFDYLTGTTDMIDAESIPVSGKFVKMDDELTKWMVEWFQEQEYFGTTDEEEIKAYIIPVMLEGRAWTTVYVFMGITAVVLLIDVAYIILYVLKRSKASKAVESEPQGPAF